MNDIRWAVIGTGAISADFAQALRSSSTGRLHAVGGRDAARAAGFAARWDAAIHGTTDEILDRDDVDAVYVGTVHTAHEEVAAAALRAGKAVLCEKPLTQDAAATRRLVGVAAKTGSPLLEAYKYRFGPLAERLRGIISDGTIGVPDEVTAGFGFAAETRAGRLFDPTVGGGAILDVGGYPVSLVVGVAAWAGLDLSGAVLEQAGGELTELDVDVRTTARVRIGAVVGAVGASIVSEVPRAVTIRGDRGWIEIPNVWGSRTASDTSLVLHRGAAVERIAVPSVHPMAAEADALARAIGEGRGEVAEMPWAHSLATAALLGQWWTAITQP